MRKLALIIIGLVLFGLAKPVSAKVNDGVLWLHPSGGHVLVTHDVNYGECYYVNDSAPFSLSYDVTIRNLGSGTTSDDGMYLMDVAVHNSSGGYFAQFRVFDHTFGVRFSNEIIKNLTGKGYCDPTAGWCNLKIVVYKHWIEWYVNGKLAYNKTGLNIDYVELDENVVYTGDLYIDNIVEKQGDKVAAEENFNDGVDNYYGTGKKYVIDKSEVPGAGSSVGGHSFDIPPGVILLALAVAALALRRE